jgi:hypothetical protein
MGQLVLSELTNIESQTAFLQALNANFTALQTAIEEKLSRVDNLSTDNTMTKTLDLNGQRMINVGTPEASSDVARWIDVYSAGVLTEYAVPSALGNSGKFLSNDGTVLYWSTSAGGLSPANNLSDVADSTTSRVNLGLGTASVYDIGSTGAKIPLTNTSHTWSAAQTWTAVATFSAGGSFTGATEWRVQTTGATSLSADSVGFRGAPQNIQDANYTFVMDDAGKGVSHSSAVAHAWTIPPDASVNFPVHTIIPLDNYGSGAVTVTRGAGVTLRANGSGTSADIALAQYFVRSLYKIGPNFWTLL